MARRHRLVTVPSGLVLFACIALPGYRQCGDNLAVRDDPYLAGGCCVGLVVAIAALAFANRRRELAIAVISTVLTTLVLGLFSLGATAVDAVFAGVAIGAAAAAGLVFGTACWLLEVRNRSVGPLLAVGGALVVVVIAITAISSTWVPPPADPPHFDLLVH